MSFKRFKSVLITNILIFFMGAGFAYAGVSISPAYVDTTLDKKRATGQFYIRNTGKETERYRIVASHFVFGENGELRKTPPDENSLVPWLKFNPKEFTLPPKSKRSIRYVIVPRGKVPDKDYWAFMELQSLKANVASASDKAGRSMKVKIIPTIIVPMFASKGKVTYMADVGEFKVVPGKKGLEIVNQISNTGKGHLLMRGTYEILNGSGAIVTKGSLGRFYILPGGVRWFRGQLDSSIPKGDYKVKVVYSDSKMMGPLSEQFLYTR